MAIKLATAKAEPTPRKGAQCGLRIGGSKQATGQAARPAKLGAAPKQAAVKKAPDKVPRTAAVVATEPAAVVATKSAIKPLTIRRTIDQRAPTGYARSRIIDTSDSDVTLIDHMHHRCCAGFVAHDIWCLDAQRDAVVYLAMKELDITTSEVIHQEVRGTRGQFGYTERTLEALEEIFGRTVVVPNAADCSAVKSWSQMRATYPF